MQMSMAANVPHMSASSPSRKAIAGEVSGVVSASASSSNLRSALVVDETITDHSLATQAASGNSEAGHALEELFKRHATPLLRFLTHKLGNEHEAEDLLHDTFVRLAEKVGSFRGDCPFRTWLFTMALNLTRSHQRRAALEEQTDERLKIRRPEMNQPKPESDPERNAQTKELWKKVEGAIKELAEAEKEIFLLYWFGEFTYSEIHSITGVGIPTAKVRVHRALKLLRSKLNRT